MTNAGRRSDGALRRATCGGMTGQAGGQPTTLDADIMHFRLSHRAGTHAGLPGLTALVWAALCGWNASPVLAVPAMPGAVVVQQPDGTKVTVILRGDERHHWHEDVNGYAVTRSRATGQWVYAQRAGDRTVPTDHVVGRSNPKILRLLQPDETQRRAAALRHPSARSQPSPPSRVVPTTGTLRNLVLLVSYADLSVAYTVQEFDDLFNQEGYTADGAVGSIRDYYHEVSYNALTVESTVVEAVTLDNGYAYYGVNDAEGWDLRPREMVEEALDKLETRGFDFSLIDGNGDGWVDCLTVIHAGRDEACGGNDEDYIWSHKWAIHAPVTYDGVSMWQYHTVPAQRGYDSTPSSWGIERIGTVCHEMGHILGLPDLYDTDGGSRGVGNFCLMSGGSWNGSLGSSPAHPSAWCRISLGWVAPTVITGAGSCALNQVETTPQIYKLRGNLPANEYFLVENRQGVGFDAALPGSSRGILIWHVDDDQANNTNPSHYMVDLEEASGTQHLELNLNGGDDTDYFRSGNATEFTSATTPDNTGYDATPLGLDVGNIGATGATMTFDVTDPDGVTVSGHVLTDTAQAVAGVLVTASPGGTTDTTDAEGYYELSLASGWSGAVTPSKGGYTFAPVSHSYSNLIADQADEDFEATPDASTVSISGHVRTSLAEAVSGVVVTANPGGDTDTTDAEGYYQLTLASGWTGTVTPTKEGVTFDPTSRSYNNVTTEQADDDFVATLTTGTLSVQTKDDAGAPVTGAIYVDGDYKGLESWSGAMTTGTHTVHFGALSGYTTPADQQVNVQQAQITAVTGTYIGPVSVTAAADDSYLTQGDSATLTATAHGGLTPYTYAWSTGQTTASITVSPLATTTYTVTVTDGLAQQAQDSVTVTVVSPVTVTVTADANAVIVGETVAVAASPSGGVQPYRYLWNTGATTATIHPQPTTTSTYTVTVYDSLSQWAQAHAVVWVTPVLSASATSDHDLVAAGTTCVLTVTRTGGASPYTYRWNTGATTPTLAVNPTATTTYTVTITDGRGQQAQASVTVQVASGVTVTAQAAPDTIQAGETSRLSASAAGGVAPYTYQWSTGATGTTIDVSPTVPTDYLILVTDGLGQTGSATVTVTVTQVASDIVHGGGCFGPPLLATMTVFLLGWTVRRRVRSTRR